MGWGWVRIAKEIRRKVTFETCCCCERWKFPRINLQKSFNLDFSSAPALFHLPNIYFNTGFKIWIQTIYTKYDISLPEITGKFWKWSILHPAEFSDFWGQHVWSISPAFPQFSSSSSFPFPILINCWKAWIKWLPLGFGENLIPALRDQGSASNFIFKLMMVMMMAIVVIASLDENIKIPERNVIAISAKYVFDQIT